MPSIRSTSLSLDTDADVLPGAFSMFTEDVCISYPQATLLLYPKVSSIATF